MRFDAESLDVALREAAPGIAPADGLWAQIEGRAVGRRRSDRRRRRSAFAVGAAAALMTTVGVVALVTRPRSHDIETGLAAGAVQASLNGPAGADIVPFRQPWTGARTSADGREILFVFTGPAPFVDGDPCTAAYVPTAVETPDRVEVDLGGRRPEFPSDDLDCATIGYSREATVRLSGPLAGRTLIDVATGKEDVPFDGALLWEPASLPAGWALESETGSSDDGGTIWVRGFGPPPETSEGVTVEQGTADWQAAYLASADRSDVRAVTIHGVPATVGLGGGGWTLTWVEDGEGTIVEARSMDGTAMEDPDALVAFAESLHRPAP